MIDAYDVNTPLSAREQLEAGAGGDVVESPTIDNLPFESVAVHILTNSFVSLLTAAEICRRADVEPLILPSSVRGEARQPAKTHVAIAEEILATGNPVELPAPVLSGGEKRSLSEVRGLAAQTRDSRLRLHGTQQNIVIAGVDTDGIDGPTEYASALVDCTTATPVTEARTAQASITWSSFYETAMNSS